MNKTTLVRLTVIFLTALKLVCSPAIAQSDPANITRYTVRDGLPGSVVYCTMTDRFGCTWIGTFSGLARYDGYEFRRFYNNPNDSASIIGVNIYSLLEDRGGQIWIGSELLEMYNPVTGKFSHYDLSQLFDQKDTDWWFSVLALCQDNRGRIYVGVRGTSVSKHGLLYIDENDKKIHRFPVPDSLASPQIYHMMKDATGNTWYVGTGGIYKIDVNRKLTRIFTTNKLIGKNVKIGRIWDLKPDKNGHIWFIDNTYQLVDYNPGDGKYTVYSLQKSFPGMGDNMTKSIAIDHDQTIWIGTKNGVQRFNRVTGKLERLDDTPGQPTLKTAVLEIRFDYFGLMWIATKSDGLLKYENKYIFKSFSHNPADPNSISPGWANTLYQANDGRLWITTQQGLRSVMNIMDPVSMTSKSYHFPKYSPGAYDFYSSFEINPGEFYTQTNHGHQLINPSKGILKPLTLPGIPGTAWINNFYKDSRNTLWLCTNHGIYRMDQRSGRYKNYDLSILPGSNFYSNGVTKVIESRKHGLWIATSNGLFLYNYATDRVEHHGYDPKKGEVFLSQDINSLCEDSRGITWVGTWKGGLSRYVVETGRIKTYTLSDGLPSMGIQGILEDEKNQVLWLSTFEGMSRFDYQAEQFYNYTVADGLQDQAFADGSYLKTSRGQFIFGGVNGITVFNPDDIQKKSLPPLVSITTFKLFDKPVIPGPDSLLQKPIYDTKEITLAHNQNSLSFEFTAIHYSNPVKNKCLYKLENYDQSWRDARNLLMASYPNLPPGKYLFRVKAANNNGVWNEKGASLSIIIRPPWWRTWWAYGLYCLVILGAIFLVDRGFRNHLAKKEKERINALELEHAREIEKAFNELKTTQAQLIHSEKMASLGELTAGIAHEIQNPLNFVNNFSDISNQLIDELKEEITVGNSGEAMSLADDVKLNLLKISQHGRKADSIVKGMLQHSRTSTGKKELTDINALADEFIGLTFHGFKARDESFEAAIQKDFDRNLSGADGKIQVIPQEIGRVFANILSNAFYAVDEKRKYNIPGYEPTVYISTKMNGNKVEITVRDNGLGIPQKIMNKIFQPFFTTKPTGQGTGLGLSLSYDIITKVHGGQLDVDSRAGEYSEFIIHLPALKEREFARSEEGNK